MSTVLLTYFAASNATGAAYRSNEALAEAGSFRSFVLVIIAIAAVVGIRLALRAAGPIAEVIKAVVAAGVSALLMAVVVALALVLAVTSV